MVSTFLHTTVIIGHDDCCCSEQVPSSSFTFGSLGWTDCERDFHEAQPGLGVPGGCLRASIERALAAFHCYLLQMLRYHRESFMLTDQSHALDARERSGGIGVLKGKGIIRLGSGQHRSKASRANLSSVPSTISCIWSKIQRISSAPLCCLMFMSHE